MTKYQYSYLKETEKHCPEENKHQHEGYERSFPKPVATAIWKLVAFPQI